MRSYKPILYKGVKDPAARDCFRLLDDLVRQLSHQTSTPSGDVPENTTGTIVTSIRANLVGKRAGDIRFNTTASIGVTNVLNEFSHTLLAIPSTAALPTHWKATNTYTYGTVAAPGITDTIARSDDVLVYPEALGTLANRALRLTITNDGTYGGLLTQSSGFSVDALSLLPNGGNALKIDATAVRRASSDFLALTQGKGLGMVDAQGTAHYWRLCMSTDGIPYCTNLGTTAP